MRQKNGLDRYVNIYDIIPDIPFESKTRKNKRAKVIKFNENAPKCEFFKMKKGEIRSQIYWCSKIDQPCHFSRCPKRKK